MIGKQTGAQEALFCGFSLEEHVPSGHMLPFFDRFVDLGYIRERLMPFYSDMGRPSINSELLLRMLIVGYVMGIRSERRLCDEVHLNLACSWFCSLGIDRAVPDHSTFSKNRHGRFRDSDVLRQLFEATFATCMHKGLSAGKCTRSTRVWSGPTPSANTFAAGEYLTTHRRCCLPCGDADGIEGHLTGRFGSTQDLGTWRPSVLCLLYQLSDRP